MPLDKPRPKTPKRLMEKRRRARINDSLVEIKNIVLQAMNRNNPRHSKLEKADILEMTVKYLRGVQGRHTAGKAPVTSSSQYRSGYTECMREVQHFFGNSDDTSTGLKRRLVDHLSRSCRVMSSSPPPTSIATGPSQQSNPFMSPSPSGVPIPRHVASIHSTKSDTLTSVPVQSTLRNSTPKLMNIQLPVLSKFPIHTLSMPTPSISLSSPSMLPPRTSAPISSSLSKPKEEATLVKPADTNKSETELNTRTEEATGSKTTKDVSDGPIHPQGVIRMTRTTEGDITVVLPHSTLPEGKLPTHLIPVYDPTSDNAHSNDSDAPPMATNPGFVAPDMNTEPGCSVPQSINVSTTAPFSIPLSSITSSPHATVVAPPFAWYTRPTILTTNLNQGTPMYAQGPVTITLPVHARIMHNLIPMQAASIMPGASNHIPIRFANPNGQAIVEDEFMWRPWALPVVSSSGI